MYRVSYARYAVRVHLCGWQPRFFHIRYNSNLKQIFIAGIKEQVAILTQNQPICTEPGESEGLANIENDALTSDREGPTVTFDSMDESKVVNFVKPIGQNSTISHIPNSANFGQKKATYKRSHFRGKTCF